MKNLSLLLGLILLVLVNACEKFSDDSDGTDVTVPSELNDSTNVPDGFEVLSFETGNLLIINESDDELVLYANGEYITGIANSYGDYLTYVPNPNEGDVDLTLFKAEDVNDLDDPDMDMVYRRWVVPVSNATNIERRLTWLVGDENTNINVATIQFRYYGGTPYTVHVYFNNRNGAKVLSAFPGQQYKKIGVDYGNYTLLYKYLYDDSGDDQGPEVIGWKETETVGGEEKPIALIANEKSKENIIVIPHLETFNQNAKYGDLKIRNNYNEAVDIYLDGNPIEYECYLETGSSANLSTIDHDEVYTYVIPMSDTVRTVKLSAITTFSNKNIASETIDIFSDKTSEWTVDGK